MWELDHKESWPPKNWCFWTVVLEKTLESPLNSKEIQPVNPKGNQSWIFNQRTHAEAEAPILWPPDVKNWLIRNGSDAGKDWGLEEKGTTGDEMVGWHHRLDGHAFERFGSWWWTGKSGMLQNMGLQRVRQNWETELKILAFSPPTLWQIEGGTVEAVKDFLFLSTKILWTSAMLSLRFLRHPSENYSGETIWAENTYLRESA